MLCKRVHGLTGPHTHMSVCVRGVLEVSAGHASPCVHVAGLRYPARMHSHTNMQIYEHTHKNTCAGPQPIPQRRWTPEIHKTYQGQLVLTSRRQDYLTSNVRHPPGADLQSARSLQDPTYYVDASLGHNILSSKARH